MGLCLTRLGETQEEEGAGSVDTAVGQAAGLRRAGLDSARASRPDTARTHGVTEA